MGSFHIYLVLMGLITLSCFLQETLTFSDEPVRRTPNLVDMDDYTNFKEKLLSTGRSENEVCNFPPKLTNLSASVIWLVDKKTSEELLTAFRENPERALVKDSELRIIKESVKLLESRLLLFCDLNKRLVCTEGKKCKACGGLTYSERGVGDGKSLEHACDTVKKWKGSSGRKGSSGASNLIAALFLVTLVFGGVGDY